MRRPGVKQPPGSESAATIRDRGAAGAVLLTARQAAQVVAFIGTLVLAHLLTPTTLGMMALGTTIVTVGTFFADGGLGAALVRKTEDPTVDELGTLSAMALPYTWRPHTKLGFGGGIIVGLRDLGLSPPVIRADLRSIVCRVRPRA